MRYLRRTHHDGRSADGASVRRVDCTPQSSAETDSIVVTHDTQLAERLADHVLFLDHSKILFYGTVGEMERSSEPLVQKFLKDDQREFQAGEVKVPRSKRRGD
jgi:ABC-type transporter Mla maintaining outer membrane lipid asymmetry ATPase subunit MlaF